MLKKCFILFFVLIIATYCSACTTAGGSKNLQIQGLKNQIVALETQIEQKDQEIESLKTALAKSEVTDTKTTKKKTVGEVKARPNVKQIQTALTNAGYNPGPIDGKIGRRTREAIRAFQKDNNLEVDGKVGKRTWAKLRDCLYKGSK